MIRKVLVLVSFVIFNQGFSQTFLNGNFEVNTANPCDYNLPNGTFTTKMSNSVGYGGANELDIMGTTCPYGVPQNGNWFVGLAGYTDAFTMRLSAPLTQGQCYKITFWDKGNSSYPPAPPCVLGLSTTNNAQGTIIYNGPVPTLDIWNQRTVTFNAPNNGQYISVSVNGVWRWLHVDNFVITSCSFSVGAVGGSVCPGGCKNITATPSGGTGPYTYSWNTGAITATINPCPTVNTTYTVTVTDATSATASTTVALTINPAINASANVVNIKCNGGTGSASASVNGGTNPYTYSWSTGQSATSISNLAAGNYSMTVTDAAGCTKTTSFTITQPAVLTATATGNNVSCNGGNNGSATVTAGGGTTNYTYSWNNGQLTATATGLVAGTYTVTVTDANACTKTATVTITQPTALVANATGVNASCGSTGSATTTVSGGTGSYTYSWNNGQTGSTATGLGQGNYTVTVTDANGCTKTATAAVVVAASMTQSSTVVNVSCNGGSNGTATASANGGISPYTYTWNNTQNAQTATGLQAGSYTFTITDNAGCTVTGSVTITQPTAINAAASGTITSCNGGSNGTASVTASGGTGALTYSWNNTQATATATGLVAGTYTVTVTDANGCTQTATATVTQPTAVTVQSGANNVTCTTTGSITCTAGGGTGAYTYLWSNGQNTQTATGVTAGTYTITVSDANGCTASNTAALSIPVLPSAVFTGSDSSGCVALCVTFSNTSANISNYSWNFGDGSNGSGASPKHCYTAPGLYTVTLTVIDNNGCTATFTKPNWVEVFPQVTAAFSASPQPTTVLNPIITFTDLSTGGANTWSWSFGDLANSTSSLQNPVFNYKDSGCYTVRLIADNQYNCADTLDDVICIKPDFEVFAPNAFTPGDVNGLNDVWNVKGIGIDVNHFELYIFDRWGQLIFKTTDPFEGWNGKANGGKEIVQQDVYVWKAFVRDHDGFTHRFIGHISVLR